MSSVSNVPNAAKEYFLHDGKQDYFIALLMYAGLIYLRRREDVKFIFNEQWMSDNEDSEIAKEFVDVLFAQLELYNKGEVAFLILPSATYKGEPIVQLVGEGLKDYVAIKKCDKVLETIDKICVE